MSVKGYLNCDGNFDAVLKYAHKIATQDIRKL